MAEPFHSRAAFLSLSPFNIANVIFHERCSIYQGQRHTEAAEESLTPLDLYNERRESETHSEVVSSCTKGSRDDLFSNPEPMLWGALT